MSERENSKSSMMEKVTPFLFILLILFAFGFGVLWQKVNELEKGGTTNTVNNNNAPSNAANNNQPQAPSYGKLDKAKADLLPKVTSEDRVKGNRNADIMVIEYSDIECPFCRRFHPTLNQAYNDYKGKIAWVYRHFPLEIIHPKAMPLAQVSECFREVAGNDGFWKFLDKSMENVAVTPTAEEAIAYAKTLGYDQAKINTCYTSGKYKDLISNMQSAGEKAGVSGTPGVFVVNKKGEVWNLPGAVPIEELKKAIDEALASK